MKLLLITLLMVTLLLPNVHALSTPQITFIPSQISVNSSFLAIVTHTEDESIRVSWGVDAGEGITVYGQIPKVDSKWVCYFSNSDRASTCGPTPFSTAVPGQKFIVTSASVSGSSTSTKNMAIGGIEISSNVVVNSTDNTVKIVVLPSKFVDGVSYAVYSSDFTPVTGKSGSLTQALPYYNGDIKLDPGIYYIAFSATGSGDSGGSVSRVVMPGIVSDGTVGTGLVSVEPVDIDIVLPAGQVFNYASKKITNSGNSSLTGLRVEVSPDLASQLSVILPKTTLNTSEPVFYTVRLQNVNNPISINARAKVYASGYTSPIGEIPIKISVSVTGLGPVTGDVLSISGEPIIARDVAVGKSVTSTFTLKNNGNSSIAGFSYNLGSLSGIVSITPANISSIPAGGTQTITVTVTPTSGGKKQGAIIINSNAGSESILVSVNALSDITSDIRNGVADLGDFVEGLTSAQKSQFGTVYDDINLTLESAQNDFDAGKYAEAQAKLEEAKAKLAVLNSLAEEEPGPPPSEIDPNLFIYAIIALVVVAIVVFVIKKMRGGKGGGEEEFPEEEYATEPPPMEEEEEEG